jgi:general secretion pathway protein C
MATSLPGRLSAARVVDALCVLLLLLLAWQLAAWTWHFLALRNDAPVALPAQSSIDPAAARRLFGEAPAASASSASNTGVRLKGVYAVDGRTLSAAVVNIGNKNDLAVRVGEDIRPGVTLAAVYPDHIIISRSGVRERVDLERRVAQAAVRPTAAVQGFRLNVASVGSNAYSLSRNELNTVLQDPRQLNYLGRIGTHPSGGVRLDQAPGGSLPDKLGLKEGDVIKNVNGQPVNSPGDLARVYQQFGTLTQIRAEILRGGTPLLLTYQIQP